MKKILLLIFTALSLNVFGATKFPTSANIWKVYSTNDSLVITQSTVGALGVVQNSWRWARKTTPVISEVQGKQLLISTTIGDITKGNIFSGVTAITLDFTNDSITQANGAAFASATACQSYINHEHYNWYRKTKIDTTYQTVSSTPISVYEWNITNSNSVPVYVRFYNAATATSHSTPIATLFVPANGTVFNGNTGHQDLIFSTACSVRCTTGPDDSDTGEPTATTSNQVIIGILSK